MQRKQAGRPPIEDDNERKKAFAVSLTENEANKIKAHHKTLTKALLSLIRKRNIG